MQEYVIPKDKLHEMRVEANTPSFKEKVKDEQGIVCANCGKSEDVQYHHIVPLFLGGTNNISNIVPLCYECHARTHGAVDMRKVYRGVPSGRKKISPPDNYKEILDEYIQGRIGTKECKELLGLKKNWKLTDLWYLKEYYKEVGIDSIKNTVDIKERFRIQKHIICKGCSSKVIYKDGRVEEYPYIY